MDWTAVTQGLRAARYAGAFTFEVQNAFAAIPEPLWDEEARFAVTIGRNLTARIM